MGPIEIYTSDMFKSTLELYQQNELATWTLRVTAPHIGYTHNETIIANDQTQAKHIAWKRTIKLAEDLYHEAMVIYQNVSPKA